MKNKKLLRTLAAMAVGTVMAAASFGMTACGHKHTFKEDWSKDSKNHWHASDCGHEDEVADLEAHKDANNDETCDVCGYSWKTNSGNEGNQGNQGNQGNEGNQGNTATVTGVTVGVKDNAAPEVEVNKTLELTATVAGTATDKSVTWTSSDPAKATVDANGVVTGVAPGEVTITATSKADTTKKGEKIITVKASSTQTPPAANTESKTILVDFADVTSVTAGQAIGTTGFTPYGDGIAVNKQGGNNVLNFGGGVWSGGALGRALGFKVEKAGKVEVTVEYSQGNAGRYLDLITADGTVLATSVEMQTTASASDVKTFTLIAYTATDDVQLYVGSHTSGIYIKAVAVKNTWTTDDSSLVPALTLSDVTIEKAITSYVVVNDKIEVSTSDITSLGKTGGTTLEGYGYTVKKDLYKGADKQDTKEITAAANDYKVVVAATLDESTITKDIPLTVTYPTSLNVIVPGNPEVSGAGYTLQKSAIVVKANDAAATPLDASVWTITYSVVADGSGSVSGEDPWTLTAGTYNVTVTASKTGVSGLTRTVSLTVAPESEDFRGITLSEWATVTNDTVVLKNPTKGTATEGSVFEVKICSTGFTLKNTKLDNDIASNHVQVAQGNALTFTLKQGYNYTIRIVTGSSGAARKMTLNGDEKTTGANTVGVELMWSIFSSTDIDTATKEFTLAISGGAARIGAIIIDAVKV